MIGEACSGNEAIELILDLKPDIVFLDIEMPSCNGLEVMRRIKDTYAGTIKFIVITAYSYFEYAQSSLRLGAKDILLKPIEAKLLIETIERVIGYNYTDNQILNDILAYIHNNFYEDIQLNECTKKFHTSPNQITRMFKKYFEVSFITYLNKVRIEKSKELLKDSELSIKEVASRVGYNNINYFYKTFKSITGITPKTFKKNVG